MRARAVIHRARGMTYFMARARKIIIVHPVRHSNIACLTIVIIVAIASPQLVGEGCCFE